MNLAVNMVVRQRWWLLSILSLCALLGPLRATHASDLTDSDALITRVAAFIDAWHDDAARADLRYFDKMAPDGVYIGTDKTERWVRDDFKAWAKPYFARGKAWEFHAFNRHIAFSADRSIIWFDEQLHTQLGLCQASGVIRQDADGLHILHYQLSVAVPNGVLETVRKQIDAFEAAAPAPAGK